MSADAELFIYYSMIDPHMPDNLFTHYLQQLPSTLRTDVLKYHQKADRIRTLTGKLLLKEAITQVGLSHGLIDSMSYTNYKRPFIAKDVDFNITHSGQCVACAAGRNMKVGIDVEELRPITPDDILAVLRDDELREMQQTQASAETILKFWTRKEAIVKASGEGLYMPPQSIYFIDELTATAEGVTWFLHQLNFGKEYIAYCVTNVVNSKVSTKQMQY